MNHSFDLEKIHSRAGLENIVYRKETGSTNDLAKTMLQDSGFKLPALILTSNQTAGRGQGSKQWHSTTGSLTFSIVLPIPSEHSNTGLAPLAVGLAVSKAIETSTNVEVQIKWPNDLICHGKKICGILVEGTGLSTRR